MKKLNFWKRIGAIFASVVVFGTLLAFSGCGEDETLKGGGTSAEPYQIETVADFGKISMWDNATEKKYFVLMNDLDFAGENVKTIAAFYGELDGQNHSLFNFDCAEGTGLFHENFGTIKNLKIAGTQLNSYSVYTSVSPTNLQTAYVGGLVDINNGTIVNCGAQNVNVKLSTAKRMETGELLSVYAGGLVGQSNGIMRYCYAKQCTVSAKGDIALTESSDGKCGAYAGGMVGGITQSATTEYCYGYGNNVETFSRGGKTWSFTKAVLYSKAGGLIGANSSVKTKYIFAYECAATASAEEAGKSKADIYYGRGEVIGVSYSTCEYIYTLETETQNVIGNANELKATVKKIGSLNLLLEDADMQPPVTEWIVDDTNHIAFQEFLYAPLITVETEANAE